MKTKEQIIEDEEYEALCEETIELIKEIYKDHAAGGALHIVLDDGTVGRYHIQWCYGWVRTAYRHYAKRTRNAGYRAHRKLYLSNYCA